uniref:Uncharacterized protein n=1 Tax=Megaselia scalaris TaxID=36166 RepID=T1GNA8_MEGSC
MDSSPDLTLKLRRGSSDSRDSFYMDFAQGIDSDIEEVESSVLVNNSNVTAGVVVAPPPPPPPLDDTGSVTTCVKATMIHRKRKNSTKEEPEDPSTSPSPPPTPPPCPPLSVAPPPSPPHHMTPMTPPDSPSHSLSGHQLSSLVLHQFEHSSDMANNDDDSTTITTPPSNGCSTLTPPVAAQLGSNAADDTIISQPSYGNISKSLNEKSTSIASATLSGLTGTGTGTHTENTSNSLLKNDSDF